MDTMLVAYYLLFGLVGFVAILVSWGMAGVISGVLSSYQELGLRIPTYVKVGNLFTILYQVAVVTVATAVGGKDGLSIMITLMLLDISYKGYVRSVVLPGVYQANRSL